MMMMHALPLLLVAGLPALLFAQPNCTDLGFGDVPAAPGTTLERCADAAEQCCSDEYLTSVAATVRERLRRFLLEEFDEVIDAYLDDVEDLIDFFSEEFIERLVDTLPGAGFLNRSDESLTSILEELVDNYNLPDEDGNNDYDLSESSDDDSSDDDSSDDDSNDDDMEDGTDEEEGDEEDDDDGGLAKRQNPRLVFTPRQFVEALVETLGDAVVRELGNGSEITEACVREVADSFVNGQVVAMTAQRIQVIRQSISALIRIAEFLQTQRARLAQATFPEECVTTFIDLAFCSRCTQKTPPLCFNTCNALLRACYSPYFTTLNDQFSQLWLVAQRVIGVANTTVQDLLEDEANLIDTEAFVEAVRDSCGVIVSDDDFEDETPEEEETSPEEETPDEEETPPEEETPDEEETPPEEETPDEEETPPEEETPDEEETSDSIDSESSDSDSSSGRGGRMIAFDIVEDIFELRGAFDYSAEGLQLCLYGLDDGEDCDAEDLREQRYCKGRDICTAECDCTAGDGLRRTDTEPFLLNDIEDQEANPVLVIDEDVLRDRAAILEDEDPVASFLASSSFQSVVPDDVETGEGDEREGTSAAGGLATSLAVFLLCLLLVASV